MNLSVFSFLGNCCVHQMCVFFLARRSSCWCAAAPSVTTDCRAQQRPAGCTQDARSAQKKPPIIFDFLWKQFLRFFQIFSLVWLYSKTASHFQNIRSRLYYSRMLMVASKTDVWISEYELLLLGHFEQIVHPLKIFARRRYQPLHVVCARCGVVVRARFPSRPAFSLQICACSSIPHAARGSFLLQNKKWCFGEVLQWIVSPLLQLLLLSTYIIFSRVPNAPKKRIQNPGGERERNLRL